MVDRLSDSEKGEVVAALVKSQGMQHDKAGQIVDTIAEHPDIAASAVEWAQSGVFPAHPVIMGKSPVDLSSEFRPSQVFTLLVAMRTKPEAVEAWLNYDRHGLEDRGAGGQRGSTILP